MNNRLVPAVLTCVLLTGIARDGAAEEQGLLDEFAAAKTVARRLALLPEIAEAYTDDKLPPQVRYLLALSLLRDHLTWHAAYAPPPRPDESRVRREQVKHIKSESLRNVNQWRWSEAHGGQPWMLDPKRRKRLHEAKEPRYFWRIKNTRHADVARAGKLLQGVNQGELAVEAEHWLAEMRRNNTVVTMDVLGAYAVQAAGPLVVDVRNAERLSLKLYRVRRVDDLAAVARRIGEHFIYRDYGLPYARAVRPFEAHRARLLMRTHYLVGDTHSLLELPRFGPKDLVHRWKVAVAKLKVLELGRSERGRWTDWSDLRDDDDGEAEFFDDRCRRHRNRLEKTYWPGWDKTSSWQCDRLLEIPAQALQQPGAYVLVVEANGRRTYAPIVVDPLAMVLRRCRDGLLVMLSDSENRRPVAGARIRGEAKTGTYSFRANVGGTERIVPGLFAVKHYRRPNFELDVTGLPETICGGQTLKLQLSGKYYFGKPLAGAKADVRLVHARGWKPLACAHVRLDASGAGKVELRLPKRLAAGTYRLIGALTDGSGRTVTQIRSCGVEAANAGAAGVDLSLLPRFVAVDAPLEVKTSAAEVTVVQEHVVAAHRAAFKVQRGSTQIKLPSPGWYTVKAGAEQTRIFAYGGSDPPGHKPFSDFSPADLFDHVDEKPPYRPRWINLADYQWEEDGFSGADSFDSGALPALFERQQVEVGEVLRLLVYVPAGEVRLLFTIEGRTVVDYVLRQLAKGEGSYRYHVIEIPVKRRYLPNFYLQGRIVSGATGFSRPFSWRGIDDWRNREHALSEGDGTEDPHWCRVDVVDPEQRLDGRQLNVSLETAVAEYRPGEKVEVRIHTSDLAGRPCEAEVSLGAVDQSVYGFGEDRVRLLPGWFSDPHPPRLYGRKTWRASRGRTLVERYRMAEEAAAMQEMAQAVQMAEQQDSLQQSLAQLTALGLPDPQDLRPAPVVVEGQLPAASFGLARRRTDFRETATWQPQLRTGADGLVETSFTLPDSLTRYRLTGVGLTRDTRIGVGRSQIEVSMPLSVQLFLPRFAVEGDRLLAVGLVHNGSDRQRTCQVAWEVAGAKVEAPGEVRAVVKLAPGKSARVTLPLAVDRLDDVTVTLRGSEGRDSDAELRTLRVCPLGRPLEVTRSGTFTGRHELELPQGFVARDLRISVSRTDLAGGLEGLAYLVDYPYGCVEQTMSRFLPAVMAKRAVLQSPVELPPEVIEKLPDVLSKGLARLYNFQHDDGSWGWWQEGRTDDRMTIYVVYGLARCKNTGTAVDAGVLERGCNCLNSRLRAGKMSSTLRPAALLALALAGRADKAMLGEDVAAALSRKRPDKDMAYLALACKRAGLAAPGEQLAARLRDWLPESTEELALQLSVQTGYGAPLAECRATTAKLLAERRGHRWGSTRATSWAVEALSQMLRYDPAPPEAKRVSISVDGRTVLDVRRPEQLKKSVCRVHLDHKDMPATEGLSISLHVCSEKPAHFTLTAAG